MGVIEKLWSMSGSVPEGRIVALDGEAGYQADLLRVACSSGEAAIGSGMGADAGEPGSVMCDCVTRSHI